MRLDNFIHILYKIYHMFSSSVFFLLTRTTKIITTSTRIVELCWIQNWVLPRKPHVRKNMFRMRSLRSISCGFQGGFPRTQQEQKRGTCPRFTILRNTYKIIYIIYINTYCHTWFMIIHGNIQYKPVKKNPCFCVVVCYVYFALLWGATALSEMVFHSETQKTHDF